LCEEQAKMHLYEFMREAAVSELSMNRPFKFFFNESTSQNSAKPLSWLSELSSRRNDDGIYILEGIFSLICAA